MPTSQSLAIEINPQFENAIRLMEETGANILITGRAGTGKSTLLEHFRGLTKKEIVVLAPTGVAAVNVSGQTIHSFFGFRPDVTAEKIRSVDDPVYRELDAIIIDEISMVRADLLDLIDIFLRRNGKVKGTPFGGVQMIFIGDLYQLPPVVPRQDRELLRQRYESEYFFDSGAFKSVEFELVELETVYRQKDQSFIDLLNGVRNRSITDEAIELLNVRLTDDEDFPENAIHLTTTNAMARERNEVELDKLEGKTYTFTAEYEGDFDEKSAPADGTLRLKKGAQVMLANNDLFGRWVNGTIGTVYDIRKTALLVELPDGDIEEVEPVTWNHYRYAWNEEKKSIESEVLGTFTQYPLKLAWAITIHKSQGKTFDTVVIDIGRGTFAPGQLYVALSRCRSLEGISLRRPVKKAHIQLDWRVVKFMTSYRFDRAEKELPLEEKIELINGVITDGSRLEITYLKADDTKTRRIIRPHSVREMEFRGKKFIGLRAFCTERQSDRTFRVDRILDIKVAEEPQLASR